MPYLPILIIIAFAIFYHRAAEYENESTVLWTGLSVLISATTFFYFRWGFLGTLLGQTGLFAGITLLRLWRNRDL